MRWLLTLFFGLAGAVLIAGGATAKQSIRCDVAAFTFSTATATLGPDDLSWTATGNTTLDCTGRPLMGIDVWEHAVVSPPTRGEVGTVAGKARILIDFTGAGIREFRGQVRGMADCTAAPLCPLTLEIRAQSQSGAHLELDQAGVLDLDTGTLSLDVVSGLLVTPPFPT